MTGRYGGSRGLRRDEVARLATMNTDYYTPRERNLTRLLFLDPARRDLYVDREDAARLSAALLRMETAGNPDDPRPGDAGRRAVGPQP